MDVFKRIFSCDCACVQKNIYTVLAVASLVTMIGSVAGSQNTLMRNRELKYVGVYLVVAVVVFLALEWLCNNNYRYVAWGVALLPLVAAVVHGYSMARAGNYEPNNIPRMVLQRYNLL
jgi:intracellular septation protein A